MKRPFVAGVYDAKGPDDRPDHPPWGAPRMCLVYARNASVAAAKVLSKLHREAGLTLAPTARVTAAPTEDFCRLVGPVGVRWVYVATASVTEKAAREYKKTSKSIPLN